MRAEQPSVTSAVAERLIGEGVVVLALLAWWAAARGLPEFILPGPVAVARRLVELFVTPEFLWHVFTSAWRVLVSIAAALLIGGGLAFLAHGVPWLEGVVDERIKPVLNSFPSIGWAILAAIWFEPGDFGVIFVEVAILIPFCLINIAEGLRNIDRELMEMGRSFTRHRARILWRLTLPLLVPYGLSATRIAYGIAWKIALVAELLGAPSGHRLSDAAGPDRGGQHDLPCHLLCHRADLRCRRAAGDRAVGAALCAPMKRGLIMADDRDRRSGGADQGRRAARRARERHRGVPRRSLRGALRSASCGSSRRSRCRRGGACAMRPRTARSRRRGARGSPTSWAISSARNRRTA